ncbi:hypothetical protein [Shewanella sp.]|uniref:hypothetical protein n=1 Tax=Shewanella sp. TaxID=50422 RepID=UPI003A979A50
MNTDSKINQLADILSSMKQVTVAVSGGVDSMTLAYFAHQVLGTNAMMVHAISPAVPPTDSQRVSEYAHEQGWHYRTVEAGEIAREEYLNNPVNRCYFCKSCLYSTLASLGSGQLISGTNMDDLGDYRPGLIAAKEHHVRHPYVEADINKATVRAIAKNLGLDSLAMLPASPCLASRVETGTVINPAQLTLINHIELMVRQKIDTDNIRCRLSSHCLEIQLDQSTLSRLSEEQKEILRTAARLMASVAGLQFPITIAPYRRGSAFLRNS